MSGKEAHGKRAELYIDKNWKITLGLCFFTGMLGTHHFYMGRPWLGFGVLAFTISGLVLCFLYSTSIGLIFLLSAMIWSTLDFLLIIFSALEEADS